MISKGIILAGGSGSRLYPLNLVANKQLQPVYDKPMIYYPLSTLMLAGIRDILIITTPQDKRRFEQLLGDGSQWGIKLSYEVQEYPKGIAEAFLIGEKFIGHSSVCLILGDNIFYGKLNLDSIISNFTTGATIFGYYVNDPERYGVVEFDPNGKAISIEEKPTNPKSNYAIPGLYLYDNSIVPLVKCSVPSLRGELEITDVNIKYLDLGKLSVIPLGRGIAWLDTGTHSSLLEASHFIGMIEVRTGLKIACLEEIAFNKAYISESKLLDIIYDLPRSTYRDYLEKVVLSGYNKFWGNNIGVGKNDPF